MGRLMRRVESVFSSLQGWPGDRTRSPIRSNFSASFADTCRLLERELLHLRAKHVLVQIDCNDSEITVDGQMRAKCRLRSQGIILTFESKFGPLQYPCDRFNDWRDNLRAIAKSLEALRTVDRYGVTMRAEQYRGWKKLTLRGDDEFANADEAAAFLARHAVPGTTAVMLMSDLDLCRTYYKKAAVTNHPDRGGDPGLFSRITAAWEVLRAWHERRKVP